MLVRCEGGMLDGKVLDKAEPETVIHQIGMTVLRVHRPYPKRKGERVTKQLSTYTEDYALHLGDEGPVYRCTAPFAGFSIGGELLVPTEGGGYDIYADRAGKLHAQRQEGIE